MANDILARLAVQIDAKTQQFGVALNTLSGQLNKFGSTVNAQAASISNFEKRVAGIQRTLGSLGVAFGAFQIANVIQDSIRRIADFEQQIATVAAIAGATGDELEKLRQDALRLGAASQFTATEVAKLQTEFGRLGFTTEEILAATEATIDLATATGEDLAAAADVAGSTVRAFGLTADETQRVVDVMAESFNRSALGLENFRESMKFVAPVSAAANISLEETTALLGVLADAGIRGSNAGTGLRRIITDLAKDGRPLTERLQELADKGLTFGGAMDEVGRFAQSALLVLTRNVDKVNEATIAYNNATGAAKETAAIMRDTLSGDIEKLTSAWDGFILSLDKSDGSLRETIQGLTQLVEAITKISNSGFGEFVADWFRLTQTVPRFVLGAIDLFATWGDEIEITKEEAGKLFGELSRLQRLAELEGKTELAQEYADKIQQLTVKFGNLNKEVDFLGPELSNAFATDIFDKVNDDLGTTVGIIASLEDKAKGFQESIKNATSIAEIRRLQHELEGVQVRLKAILDPSIAPEPIKIPIEFAEPDLSIQEFSDRILALGQKIVIPVELDIPPEKIHEAADKSAAAGVAIVTAFTESFNSILQEFIANSLVAFGEAIGNAFSGEGFGSFGEDMLKAIAAFLGQFGKMLIAAGVAAIALKKLLVNPITAIAAGVALVALSKAVSNSVSKSAQNVGTGGSVGGGGSGETNATRLAQSAREQRIDFGGEVRFVFDGREMVGALKAEQSREGRLAGG